MIIKNIKILEGKDDTIGQIGKKQESILMKHRFQLSVVVRGEVLGFDSTSAWVRSSVVVKQRNQKKRFKEI